MNEDTYRCVCHTCDVERLVGGLEDAQAVFNEHAERSHEVVLFNQQTIDRYASPPAPEPDAGDDRAESQSDGDRSDED